MDFRKIIGGSKMAEDLVIVRAYEWKPLVRAVLDVLPGGMLVCMPENAEPFRRGKLAEPLVGFPNDDVFRYGDKEARAIGKGEQIDWHQLRPMKEAAN
jgi:hypothetical protein